MEQTIMKKETLLVNLYAGPGTGKSTSMAGLFYELKLKGVNCEMAPEYAKEKVWEESTAILGNQPYVFGKQLNTIYRVNGKVDVIITDSPILLSVIYGKNEGQAFENLVLDVCGRFRTLNVFLERVKKFNPSGRLQNEEEAKCIDKEIRTLLDTRDIPYVVMPSGRETIDKMTDMVMSMIGQDKAEFV
jgi:hypothetical protein